MTSICFTICSETRYEEITLTVSSICSCLRNVYLRQLRNKIVGDFSLDALLSSFLRNQNHLHSSLHGVRHWLRCAPSAREESPSIPVGSAHPVSSSSPSPHWCRIGNNPDHSGQPFLGGTQLLSKVGNSALVILDVYRQGLAFILGRDLVALCGLHGSTWHLFDGVLFDALLRDLSRDINHFLHDPMLVTLGG